MASTNRSSVTETLIQKIQRLRIQRTIEFNTNIEKIDESSQTITIKAIFLVYLLHYGRIVNSLNSQMYLHFSNISALDIWCKTTLTNKKCEFDKFHVAYTTSHTIYISALFFW